MRALIDRLLGNQPASKEDAKSRLKFLLIHDQVDLTPGQMEAMKDEIMEVIGRYVEFDGEESDFRLARLEDKIALVSSFPVRRTLQRAAHA